MKLPNTSSFLTPFRKGGMALMPENEKTDADEEKQMN